MVEMVVMVVIAVVDGHGGIVASRHSERERERVCMAGCSLFAVRCLLFAVCCLSLDVALKILLCSGWNAASFAGLPLVEQAGRLLAPRGPAQGPVS